MFKGTGYFVSAPTKTRASALVLLKQFVTFTKRKIRYLQIDCAKEFQSEFLKKSKNIPPKTMSCSNWW